jgi:hypothetical protein
MPLAKVVIKVVKDKIAMSRALSPLEYTPVEDIAILVLQVRRPIHRMARIVGPIEVDHIHFPIHKIRRKRFTATHR